MNLSSVIEKIIMLYLIMSNPSSCFPVAELYVGDKIGDMEAYVYEERLQRLRSDASRGLVRTMVVWRSGYKK